MRITRSYIERVDRRMDSRFHIGAIESGRNFLADQKRDRACLFHEAVAGVDQPAVHRNWYHRQPRDFVKPCKARLQGWPLRHAVHACLQEI